MAWTHLEKPTCRNRGRILISNVIQQPGSRVGDVVSDLPRRAVPVRLIMIFCQACPGGLPSRSGIHVVISCTTRQVQGAENSNPTQNFIDGDALHKIAL
jgi:hypothetical protein